MDDSGKKLTLRGISCRVVLSEKQQNPPLFYFNSSNSTMELLIKYLGGLLVKKPNADVRRFPFTRSERRSLKQSSAGRLGELMVRDQKSRLQQKSQKGVFNQMGSCYQFQSVCGCSRDSYFYCGYFSNFTLHPLTVVLHITSFP